MSATFGEEIRPNAPTLPELFEAQASCTPEATALVSRQLRMSYGELNARANQLAHYLIDHGVGPEQLVAVALPRSAELVVALLGVLKAGAALLPLDLDAPAERTAAVLDDARPTVLIGDTRHHSGPRADLTNLLLDDPATAAAISAHSQRDLRAGERGPLVADNAAYVSYPPTGTLRGVVIPHDNAVRLFAAIETRFGCGAQDVWTLFPSPAGDFPVWELCGALLHGGRLVLVPDEVSRSPQAVLALLAREQVTVLSQSPSGFAELAWAERKDPAFSARLALRCVVFPGDPPNMSIVDDWCARHPDGPKLVTLYGTAETTAVSAVLELDRKPVARRHASRIGRALPEHRLYVLDSELRPTPPGVVGELYIAGEGVARGYLGQRGATAERFVADPFGPEGARMYRCGELVRRRVDGTVDLVRGADHEDDFRVDLAVLASAGLGGVR